MYTSIFIYTYIQMIIQYNNIISIYMHTYLNNSESLSLRSSSYTIIESSDNFNIMISLDVGSKIILKQTCVLCSSVTSPSNLVQSCSFSFKSFSNSKILKVRSWINYMANHSSQHGCCCRF